ncbi:hypothetical protein L4C54_19825 [Vibrio lamellibrachiae]|uniref:hypothetical protein n=1 Tax=Vibrio lamellibrachiae TaxID=2910253 RepID=UPI003D0DB41C
MITIITITGIRKMLLANEAEIEFELWQLSAALASANAFVASFPYLKSGGIYIMADWGWALVFLILVSIFSWMGFAYSRYRARTSTELGIVSVISKTKVAWAFCSALLF